MSKLAGVGLKSFTYAMSNPIFHLESLAPLLKDADPQNFGENYQVIMRLKQLESLKATTYTFWRAVVLAIDEPSENRVKKFKALIQTH